MRKEIGIKETPERWIEVSTPQIVQPSLLIIHIPAIPEGLDRTQRAGKRTSLTEHLAPSIVRIRYHFGAVVVNQPNDVTLQVVVSAFPFLYNKRVNFWNR